METHVFVKKDSMIFLIILITRFVNLVIIVVIIVLLQALLHALLVTHQFLTIEQYIYKATNVSVILVGLMMEVIYFVENVT